MRGFRTVAAYLLPAFASSIAIVTDGTSADVPSTTAEASRLEPATNIDYQPGNGFVKFSVPCPECSEAERKTIEKATFTFNIVESRETCSETTGISRHEQAIPRGQQTYQFGSSELQIVDDFDIKEAEGFWSTSCACLEFEQDGSCPLANYARILVFYIHNALTGSTPGFTITYKESKKPEILRLSLFPDTNALWDLENSIHWQSPSLVSFASLPAPESRIYHSSVLDQSLSFPTGSRATLPAPTGIVVHPLGTPTISSARSAATPLPFDHQSLQLPIGRSVLRDLDSARRSGNPVVVMSNPIEDLGAKAKSLMRTAIGAFRIKTSQRYIMDAAAISHDSQKEVASMASDEISKLTSITVHPNLPSNLATSAEALPSETSAGANDSPPLPIQHQTLRHDQAVRAFQVTSLIIILVSLSTCIFVHLFRNPRRRADRAARREERARRRLYQRAIRCHKFKNWVSRIRGRFPGSSRNEPIAETWQEKQTVIARSDDPGSMRDELRALRTAHEVVDGILKAEEGRSHGIRYKSRLHKAQRQEFSFYGSSIIPGPPPYEETYDENDIVADGFQYTPAVTSYTLTATDCTPDSSVIDTSPRTSIYMRDSDSEKD
ncbi:hypothetical protein MMC13_003162 [Lambiella insularis]|nr:hypothetical protein [Lambiella insularis]